MSKPLWTLPPEAVPPSPDQPTVLMDRSGPPYVPPEPPTRIVVVGVRRTRPRGAR